MDPEHAGVMSAAPDRGDDHGHVDRRRLYLSNDSYPELRDVRPRWAVTVAWWRAIGHALGDRRFWSFVAVQVGLLLAVVALAVALSQGRLLTDTAERWVYRLLAAGWFMVFAYLQVSWGGDLMRSHLRAVSEKARHACPCCGHNLVGHLDGGDDPVRCPECATHVARRLFEPPYAVPRAYRAFPPWRPRPRTGRPRRN